MVTRESLSSPTGTAGELRRRLDVLVMPVAHRRMFTAVAELVGPGPEDALLDVGCGAGAFLARHGTAARRVAGIDRSDVQVARACRRLADRIGAGTAEVVCGDAVHMPWRDGTFSAVTAMYFFEVMPRTADALREIHRVLAPGGRLVVSLGVPDPRPGGRWLAEGWPVWSDDEARTMVREAGFGDEELTYVPWARGRLARGVVSRTWGVDSSRVVLAHGR